MLNPSFTDECNHTKDNNSDINSSKDNNLHVYPIPYSDLDDNLHPGSEIIQRNLFINNAIQLHLINKTIQHHRIFFTLVATEMIFEILFRILKGIGYNTSRLELKKD